MPKCPETNLRAFFYALQKFDRGFFLKTHSHTVVPLSHIVCGAAPLGGFVVDLEGFRRALQGFFILIINDGFSKEYSY